MPSYKKYLVTASLICLFTGCSEPITALNIDETVQRTYKKVDNKYFPYEDQYIIYALEYENQKAFNNAKHLYLKLFENTNKYEYLVRYLTLSFQLRDYKSVDEVVKSNSQIAGIKEEEDILRLHTFSLIRLKRIDEALDVSKRLIEVNKRDINYELLGTIYLELKKYNESYAQFEKAFALNKSSFTILSLTNIQYYYLDEKEEAKDRLERYISENGYIYNTSFQLLSFYEKEKETEKIVNLLENMYKSYEFSDEVAIFGKIKNLLVRYLAKEDINKAIKFLEEKDKDNVFLVSLYRSSQQMDKLYVLLEKLYERTKNVDFLAQMAIVEFETAEVKEDVLNSVIEKFDKALLTLNNAIYQNYLAYLLIDYDKDIEKGLVLVKKALKHEPDNLAYIDTLAWGEYKLNNCDEAYKQMKIVVEEAGLDDKEIKFHWEKIKECIK